MTFNTIAHLSEAYQEMIALRVTVLLQPIGISPAYINPEKEADDLLLGVYTGEKLVACCVLTDRGNGFVQLRQMAVATQLQGQGVGASLIRYAEKIAVGKGFATLFMHARNPVVDFYKRCGYTIAGEEFFEVGLGHRRMEKTLPATTEI